MLKLYYAAGTCALASHTALEETGAEFETVAHSHRMRGYRWADDPAAIKEMQRKAPPDVQVQGLIQLASSI